MNTKITTLFLIAALLLVSAPAAFAQTRTNDWNALQTRTNSAIAVKAENRKTVTGVLIAHDNAQITISVVEDTVSQIRFNRAEVEKVWLAELRGGRRTKLGALIGAGAGAGVGLAAALSVDSADRDGLEGLAVPLFGIVGAGIGGVIGFLAKKKNKKTELIYQK